MGGLEPISEIRIEQALGRGGAAATPQGERRSPRFEDARWATGGFPRWGLARPGLGALVLVVLLLSCAGPPRRDVVHVVKPGENLYRIAKHYGVETRDVVLENGVRDVRRIPVGTRLFIPDARRPPAMEPIATPEPERTGPIPRTREAARQRAGKLRFAWPVRGRLTSRFGWRRGRPHEGIDVASRSGTAVRAAEAGKVIYSSGLGAYGNVVIVRHDARYETVYAHNRRNRVRKGARVERGQVIAELGDTGNATGPHLHFEIREHDRARDPLLYLP